MIKPEEILKFFEQSTGAVFIDVDSGVPVLDIIDQKNSRELQSDYDKWLDQQDDSIKQQHAMGEI